LFSIITPAFLERLLGRPTALNFTHELYLFVCLFVYLFIYFLSFCQSTAPSTRAVDGHQMYFGGSVVGNSHWDFLSQFSAK